MPNPTPQAVLDALRLIIDPDLGKDVVTLGETFGNGVLRCLLGGLGVRLAEDGTSGDQGASAYDEECRDHRMVGIHVHRVR